ncbi:MAG: radical SAM family heme chaperone HemW [Desulfamplus sp.]|nr:radical SAM family heme chaperone HemW [Desulfamplus sp.]
MNYQKQSHLSVKHAGIYIHIPFCIKKCPYCDFYSISELSLKEPFILALLKEIELRSDTDLVVDTIYFGGGTPSLLTSEELEKILSAVAKNFKLASSKSLADKVSENLQITFEVNPGSLNPNKIKDGSLSRYNYLKEIKKIGVNRLSIGVQSFDNNKLNFLNRIHSSDDAQKTILSARDAGFDDIGFDLIYGLPDERQNLWLNDLNSAIEYSPEHLSCYMLSYEPETPMFRAYKRGDITPLDDESVASLFRLTSKYLTSNSFCHYEVSNFASSYEHQSKHNKKYWQMVKYLGFGPSAHSYNGQSERFWNIKSVEKYILMVNQGRLPIAEKEILTDNQRLIEYTMVGLRTEKGVELKYFKGLKGLNSVIDEIKQRAWGEEEECPTDGDRLRLTPDGWLFLDTITRWFVDLIEK